MIIVSQDKETITNFDNILGMQIDEHIFNSDGEKDYEIKIITEKRIANIGVYQTKERAKEVVDEIGNAYVVTQMLLCPTMTIATVLKGEDVAEVIFYKMPEA